MPKHLTITCTVVMPQICQVCYELQAVPLQKSGVAEQQLTTRITHAIHAWWHWQMLQRQDWPCHRRQLLLRF